MIIIIIIIIIRVFDQTMEDAPTLPYILQLQVDTHKDSCTNLAACTHWMLLPKA
jgi:hypothetical protein